MNTSWTSWLPWGPIFPATSAGFAEPARISRFSCAESVLSPRHCPHFKERRELIDVAASLPPPSGLFSTRPRGLRAILPRPSRFPAAHFESHHPPLLGRAGSHSAPRPRHRSGQPRHALRPARGGPLSI